MARIQTLVIISILFLSIPAFGLDAEEIQKEAIKRGATKISLEEADNLFKETMKDFDSAIIVEVDKNNLHVFNKFQGVDEKDFKDKGFDLASMKNFIRIHGNKDFSMQVVLKGFNREEKKKSQNELMWDPDIMSLIKDGKLKSLIFDDAYFASGKLEK